VSAGWSLAAMNAQFWAADAITIVGVRRRLANRLLLVENR
jgi:hypothetical protein